MYVILFLWILELSSMECENLLNLTWITVKFHIPHQTSLDRLWGKVKNAEFSGVSLGNDLWFFFKKSPVYCFQWIVSKTFERRDYLHTIFMKVYRSERWVLIYFCNGKLENWVSLKPCRIDLAIKGCVILFHNFLVK